MKRADVLRELADAGALLTQRRELHAEIREGALCRTRLREQLLLGRPERALHLGPEIDERLGVRGPQLAESLLEQCGVRLHPLLEERKWRVRHRATNDHDDERADDSGDERDSPGDRDLHRHAPFQGPRTLRSSAAS